MEEHSLPADPPTPRSFWQRQLHPTRAERRRMRRRQIWVALVLAYAALGFAYGWQPEWRNAGSLHLAVSWTAFVIRVLQFHLGLLVALLAVAALAGRQWRAALVALPLLVFTLGPSLRSLAPKGHTGAAPALRVVSCNLLMINTSTQAMGRQLADLHADVIAFQEYTDLWHASLRDLLGKEYPYVVYFPRDDSFGAAIYSRHPFLGKPAKYLAIGDNDVPQMRAELEIEGRPVAVYNIHLLPPAGRAYIEEQQRQFADLLDRLAEEPLPTIVAGDFNFTETTAFAAALADAGYADAYDQGGWGRGATWPELGVFRWAPGIRLDHIYLSPELRCASARTLPPCGSDHRALVADIAFTSASLSTPSDTPPPSPPPPGG